MILTLTAHLLLDFCPGPLCVLDAIELAFQLSDRFAVCVHLFAGRIPVLVELVD